MNLAGCFKDFLKWLESSEQWYDVSKDFTALKTNSERVNYVSRLEWFQQVKFGERTRIKSSSDSRKWLDKAQTSFVERTPESKCTLALSYCNRSLMSAPLPLENHVLSDEFLAALTLRSSILFSLAMFKGALFDVELILSAQMSPDALELKAQCCFKLELYAEAILSYEELTVVFKDARDAPNVSRIKSILPSLRKKAEKKSKVSVTSEWKDEKPSVTSELNTDKGVGNSVQNTAIPEATESPKKVSTVKGFNVLVSVGNERKAIENISSAVDILPGEVVLEEDPFSCVMLLDHVTDLCYGCFKRCERLPSVVCPDCALVMYCSTDCKKHAAKFHSIECPILEWFVNDDCVSDVRSLLALRTLVQLRHCCLSDCNCGDSCSISDDGNISLNGHCVSQLKLPDGCVPWSFDLFTDTFLSVLIVKLLCEQTNYLELVQSEHQLKVGKDNELHSYLSESVLNYFVKMSFFCHPVMETINQKVATGKKGSQHSRGSSSHYLAYGLYLAIAALEHSCHPNSVIVFYGTTAKLIAIRTIPKGESVTVNRIGVGFIWCKAASLNSFKPYYNYACKCKACVEDWSAICNRYHLCSVLQKQDDDFRSLLKDKSQGPEFFKKVSLNRQTYKLLHDLYCEPQTACVCKKHKNYIQEFITSFCRYVAQPHLYTGKLERVYCCCLSEMGNRCDISIADCPEVLATKLLMNRNIEL